MFSQNSKEPKRNEDDFFEILYPYYERLYIKALSILKNKEDAKDVLQDALMAAYKSFSKFQGKSNVYTWLYKILVNKCYDFLKKSKKEENLLVKINDPYLKKSNSFVMEEFEKLYEQNEIFKSLIHIINTLESKYREIIIMRYFDGLSYEEISQVKNIKLGTVKSRLSKAKEKLNRKIQEFELLKSYFF
ncbi:MAG: RNA polymerase sigma factor [Leptonema sp. (in: bacteria)]